MPKIGEALWRRSRLFGLLVCSMVQDSLFFGAWLGTQWIVSRYMINPLTDGSTNLVLLELLEITFAISTLVPLLIVVAMDVLWLIVEFQNELRRSVQSGRRRKR